MEENSFFSAQKVHFTYHITQDKKSLCQGDLLELTASLREAIKTVYPYFLEDDDKYCMVLTQSCDLVKRKDDRCKASYISLARVQKFDTFFEKYLLSKLGAERINEYIVLDSKKKDRAYQFLERLYNNTESDYFFLYQEEALALHENMIALLRCSVPLNSDSFYGVCLEAKTIELADEFKAKLGWLLGDIYSRVGTTDWESIMTQRERVDMINKELVSHCIISQRQRIQALKKILEENEVPIADFLENFPIETNYEKAINAIEKIVKEPNNSISEDMANLLIQKIRNNATLKSLIPQ